MKFSKLFKKVLASGIAATALIGGLALTPTLIARADTPLLRPQQRQSQRRPILPACRICSKPSKSCSLPRANGWMARAR